MRRKTNNPAVTPHHDAPSAPFVFFDFTPMFGIVGGTVQVELTARVLKPGPDAPISETVTVAHLQCGPGGALNLISALQDALDMLEKQQQPDAAKLN